MYSLRDTWNPSTTECRSYCKTQKPSEEKTLKGMEVSSLQVCNSTLLALFKHDLKQDSRQAAFPPPQQHTPRSLGKLDDTHPNQRNLHPPFNPGHSAEKRQTKQGKKPPQSSRKHYLRCSEVCCRARKGQELDVAQPKWTRSLQCTSWLHKCPTLSGYFSKMRSYCCSWEQAMAHTIT